MSKLPHPDITGPVIPLPTPFTESEDIDIPALEHYVGFLADSDIPAVMTTVGTSRFNLLSTEEVIQLNKVTAEATGSRCISIVSSPMTGHLQSVIEVGKAAERDGADFFLLYFHERFYGLAHTVEYFRRVTEAIDLPVLLHEMPMRNGLGAGSVPYSFDLLDALFEIPTITGMKEEALDNEYSPEVVKRYAADRIIIGAGGGMSRYLERDHKLGATAFLGGIGNFTPSMEIDFFNDLQTGDGARARRIVEAREMPFFQAMVPIGWHPGLKACLASKGLMSHHERWPMKQLTDEERRAIDSALEILHEPLTATHS